MEQRRLLAIAAATGKVGYVFLIDDRLMDWGISNQASESSVAAAGYAQTLINDLRPSVVVTEKVGKLSQKGDRTIELIEAIARVAEYNYLLDVAVLRVQRFPNKYDEARDMAKRWEELRPYASPTRKAWETEPTNMIYFEAMGLAERVF